jgi:hypothetical protein
MEKIIRGIAIGRENVAIDDTHQPSWIVYHIKRLNIIIKVVEYCIS